MRKKVYDILSIDAVIFKLTKAADMAWDLLEDYGFQNIEKIILSTGDNRDRLANVIFADSVLVN